MWKVPKEILVIMILFLGFLVMSILLIWLFRRIQINQFKGNEAIFQKVEFLYWQIESLFSLFSVLEFQHPLPRMRRRAISPDFAKLLVEVIYREKPLCIVELGSGISTLIIGYCLRKLDQGNVLSFDHDVKFIKITQENVNKHGLESITQVIHAPLKEIVIRDNKWLWYDTDSLKSASTNQIDMLIIDGPPDGEEIMARYPALPIFMNSLNEDAVIILDDGIRSSEQKIVHRWLNEFGCLKCEYLGYLEKGAFIIRKE